MIEGGIVSFLLFGAFLIVTLKNGFKTEEPVEKKIFAGIIIGILIAALFSYPLHNPTILFLLFISCAYINANTISKWVFEIPKNLNKWFGISKAIVGSLLLFYFISQYLALGWWRKAKENILVNETKGLTYYKKAYPLLKHKGEFLFNYGAQLYQMGLYDKSLIMFTEAEHVFSHYNLFIYKGNNHQELQQYKEAEKYYTIASNMIPSKLYPKSLLAKLYFESGDSTKAYKIAKEVLLFKPKVESSLADSIKKDMTNILNYEK